VRYRHWEMLDILALESHRAGAYIVGEDLGTVEDFVRQELFERGVLSYRLLWFEPHRPPDFPVQALAAVTTHDLPTVAGMWSGADLAECQALGLDPNEEGARAIRDRLADWSGSPDDPSSGAVVVNPHRLMADARRGMSWRRWWRASSAMPWAAVRVRSPSTVISASAWRRWPIQRMRSTPTPSTPATPASTVRAWSPRAGSTASMSRSTTSP